VTHFDTAMVLAAGFGKRMRPLTETKPKPLIELAGKPLIDWTMERLRAGGVRRFVVNSHYLGEQIEFYFENSSAVSLSPESEILDTGGGVLNALPFLGFDPFIVANADTFWTDGAAPAAERLAEYYDPLEMDVLLLLHPVERAGGDYTGNGDFHLGEDGRLRRRAGDQPAPFLFAGVSVLRPDLFDGMTVAPFSLNRIFDAAAEKGRLFGLVHDGDWYHVGTPEALEETTEIIEKKDAP